MTIKKILIANRGEIAVRIIRAAKELGIQTVQAVSSADRNMLAALMADTIVEIGPAAAGKSYLNKDAILKAALDCGADAIHPGYGFLSENADFAAAVVEAGIIFIGPRPETIRAMGDKVSARRYAIAAGVPVVPGSEGKLASLDEALILADQVGYPVMIKASGGGGGRGIRVAYDEAELRTLMPQAKAEAAASFGDDGLYLEAYIKNARHVEVQLLGDGRDVVHLFERECSLQRRRQKVWEEAPAAFLSESTREALCTSAVRLAKAVEYSGAGTLEYLYDHQREAFYFIEMNTRVQVEHPITEMITGIDIVREGIRVAGGSRLSMTQAEIRVNGHAIEVRINAEDPKLGFRPSPGTVSSLTVPGGPGIRFDTMLYPSYVIPPYYDSLLGKLIVWDDSRENALRRLSRALDELKIAGVATTVPLHKALAKDRDVIDCAVHTGWLEQWLDRNSNNF